MSHLSRNFLIFGVSKGLGKAILDAVPQAHDRVFGVSRTPPQSKQNVQWIEADLSNVYEAIAHIENTIHQERIDVLIYNVGLWEQKAFSNDYDFKNISRNEIQNMLNVNLHSCILSLQTFMDNLKRSNNAKVILIGSTWGLDNHNGKELIFSASKYALRGIAQSLREILREYQIGVSVLNLGYLATDFDIEVPVTEILKATDHQLIPLADVIAAINFIISTSAASCVKEITMPAMADRNI